MSEIKDPTSTFALGKCIQSDKFSGPVWLKWLNRLDDTFNCPLINVTFAPGCRNNWHIHPDGQILLVTDGVGLYQERGKQVQIIKKGDVVKILPNIEHWHGASPDSAMSHIAIDTNAPSKPAIWLEPVSDEDYLSTAVPYTQN